MGTTYFVTESRDYGHPNEKLVKFAYNFLLPDKIENVQFYKEFLDFVNQRFSKIGCVAIWKNGCSPFSSLVGTKEVIIDKRSVRTSKNYKAVPQTAIFI